MIVEVVLGLFVILLLWNFTKKPGDYPPGFWGLPLIGYIPIIPVMKKKSLTLLLNEEQKRHGDVIMWRMGTQIMIFLFDYKMIKEAFNKQEFINRPELEIFKFFHKDVDNAGLISSNGLVWQERRRFSLRRLRDLGMGKSYLASAIQQEAEELVKELKKHVGKPIHPLNQLTISVLNIVWQMIASKRYDFDDPRMKQFQDVIERLTEQLAGVMIPDFLPWTKHILPTFLADRLLGRKLMKEFVDILRGIMLETVDEHKKNFDLDNPKDYIDDYLAEMSAQENNPDSTMSENDLLVCLNDLFNAGSGTTSVFLVWSVFYLTKFPHVQKKLQKEVDEVVPKGTLASLEDKPRLNYTEAFIHEVHRYSSMTPVGVMHCAVQDTKLGGYTIPKGSLISTMAAHCHFDPKYWEDPQEFRPERFLDENGKFVHPKEAFLPFGIGKRQCLGEPLARMELLIFITTLVQSLSFSHPPGKMLDITPITTPFNNLPKRDQEVVINIR